MSLRGVRQCQRIMIRYSDLDGSSRGVREWMSTNISQFATENPAMIVETVSVPMPFFDHLVVCDR